MNRFTFENGDGYYAVNNDNCFEDQSEDYCGPAIDRLAAYEDTGLLPQEVSAKVMWADSAAKALANIFGNVGVFDLSKLNDLKKSAEQSWIPVTERLPDKMDKYLCRYVFGENEEYPFEQVLWYYTRVEKPHFQNEGSMGLRVTHWMPLPDLSKEDA